MPWTNQPGPTPQRSEEQLLDAVHHRAAAIRRTRRARFTAGVGVVVTVLLTAALARAGDDPSSELRVVGPASTTSATSPVLEGSSAGTSTAAASGLSLAQSLVASTAGTSTASAARIVLHVATGKITASVDLAVDGHTGEGRIALDVDVEVGAAE